MDINITPNASAIDTESRTEFWQRHIKQWQRSELSKSAYCKQQALVYHQMVYWCQKLQGGDDHTMESVSSGFIPVTVSTPYPVSGLSIRLPSGAVIEGIDQHNIACVAKLVQQL